MMTDHVSAGLPPLDELRSQVARIRMLAVQLQAMVGDALSPDAVTPEPAQFVTALGRIAEACDRIDPDAPGGIQTPGG